MKEFFDDFCAGLLMATFVFLIIFGFGITVFWAMKNKNEAVILCCIIVFSALLIRGVFVMTTTDDDEIQNTKEEKEEV